MGRRNSSDTKTREESAMWTKPAFTDLRIGFEVTMYFANR
jgi:coenzyme PQQ precursor peptide PqqA